MAAILLLLGTTCASAQDSRGLRENYARLYGEQRYEDLLRALTPRLGADAAVADLWIMVAEASFKLEDHDAAIAAFEQGRKLNPALRETTINLGFAYLKRDRLDDASAHFDAFTKDASGPRRGKAHYGLALVCIARGEREKARLNLDRSAAADPTDARPHYRIAQLALEGGDTKTAIERFAAALARDPLHLGAAHGLARTHALAGHAREASEWTLRHQSLIETVDAVALMIRKLGAEADPAAARIAIGRRLAVAGATASARTWYERALRIAPDNSEARRLLADDGPGSRR